MASSLNLKRWKLDLKPPTTQKGVREFLGMVGYYRKLINRFADAARPITRLTRRDFKFEWSKDCQIGFKYLKHSLTKTHQRGIIIHRCL